MNQNLLEKIGGKITLKHIVYGFLEIVFLIIIITILNLNQSSSSPIINIENLPQGIPDKYNRMISHGLISEVVFNTDNLASIDKKSAAVRQDTLEYEYDNEYNVYHGEFVIDLASLRQSYYVDAYWSETFEFPDEPIEISCIPYEKKNLIIYEDFRCRDSDNIEGILPATIAIESPLLEKVRQKYPEPNISPALVTINLKVSKSYSDKNKILDYSVMACGDENIVSESHSIVQDWINFSGFDPDNYVLNLIDICSGH